jgi:hypothetical protein
MLVEYQPESPSMPALSMGASTVFDERPDRSRSPCPRWLPGRRVKPAGPRQKYKRKGDQNMDFGRGIVDLARAIDEGRQPHLSARYCLHATELVLTLNTELRKSSTYTMTTSCDPPEPSWSLG